MGFWGFVGIIVSVALGVALGLKIYNDPGKVVDFILASLEFIFWKVPKGIFKFITRPFRYILKCINTNIEKRRKEREEIEKAKEEEYQQALANGDEYAKVSKDNYFLFKAIREKEEAENAKKEMEKAKEEEYQQALANGDEYAKVSKDNYFLFKAIREKEENDKVMKEVPNKGNKGVRISKKGRNKTGVYHYSSNDRGFFVNLWESFKAGFYGEDKE